MKTNPSLGLSCKSCKSKRSRHTTFRSVSLPELPRGMTPYFPPPVEHEWDKVGGPEGRLGTPGYSLIERPLMFTIQ